MEFPESSTGICEETTYQFSLPDSSVEPLYVALSAEATTPVYTFESSEERRDYTTLIALAVVYDNIEHTVLNSDVHPATAPTITEPIPVGERIDEEAALDRAFAALMSTQLEVDDDQQPHRPRQAYRSPR